MTTVAWGDLTDEDAGKKLSIVFPWHPEPMPFVYHHRGVPGTQEAEFDPTDLADKDKVAEPIAYHDTLIHWLTWPDGTTAEVQMRPELTVTVEDEPAPAPKKAASRG